VDDSGLFDVDTLDWKCVIFDKCVQENVWVKKNGFILLQIGLWMTWVFFDVDTVDWARAIEHMCVRDCVSQREWLYTVVQQNVDDLGVFDGEVGGWGRDPFSRKLMSPTPRRKWYLTTGRRFH